jgi:hypothetical protein
VIGALAFIGAASKGDSVFGPLFWIGIGTVLLYLKREKEENNKEKTIAETATPLKTETLKVKEKKPEVIDVEQNSPVTFEQKEAAVDKGVLAVSGTLQILEIPLTFHWKNSLTI